jgi:iron complex outermembrane receptor protein
VGLFGLALTTAAFGQSDGEEQLLQLYGDRITISTATGTSQALGRAPAVATVITAGDIKAMGATDLDEVMETVPGVHVARSPILYSPIYVMRGMFDSVNTRILVLQNGIPVTTMFNGDKGLNWSGLPLENIARIEIIRGPGSALYGADAYAGVINIITKRAEDTPGTEVGMRAGSFGSWDIWAQHGGRFGPFDLAAYLRLGSTDGAREIIAADFQSRRDRLSGTSASLAPGPTSLGRDTIDATVDLAYRKWRWRAAYKLRDNVGTGTGIGNALDPTSHMRSERITADLSWLDPDVGHGWGLGFNVAYLHYADTAPGNVFLAPAGAIVNTAAFPDGLVGGPNKWERQFRLSGYASYSGFAGHRLRIGIGHEDLDLYRTATYKNYLIDQMTGAYTNTGTVGDYSDIQPFMRPQRRLVNYAYLQDEWTVVPDWTLTAGLRHDDYSDVGSTTNPRLALVWDARHDLTFKLLAGQAFRAPSFNELYGLNNPVSKGNPGLHPETVRTLEAAFSWQAAQTLQLSANLFAYRMKDQIVATKNPVGPASFYTYQNAGEQRGIGGECELVWDATRSLRLTASYSRQRARDVANDTDAGYAPHNHVHARGDWRFAGNWLASTQINWIDTRKRAYGDARADLGGYTTVDLTLRTDRRDTAWEFAASIRNVFNQQILEPSFAPGTTYPYDLPQPRRSFYFQASRLL